MRIYTLKPQITVYINFELITNLSTIVNLISQFIYA